MEHVEKRHPSHDRPEVVAIDDMNLAASAGLLRVFLEGRLEHGWPEIDSREIERVHRRRKRVRVNPRRTHELERTRRAASFRQDSAFEQHRAGVHDRRIQCRHVG